MASSNVQTLLKDHETELCRDRRSAARKPFSRYVQIATGRHRDKLFDGFTRDISHVGVGTVCQTEWTTQTYGLLTIHLLNSRSVVIEAQARWTEPYGKGWYLTGWTFMD